MKFVILRAVPAVLSDLAHGASQSGGYDYAAAWDSLYDGAGGLYSGLQVTLPPIGAVLLAGLASPRVATGRARPWLLGGALAAGAVALATAKFPADASDGWGRTIFETGVWMLHLFGGAIWIGGLTGLLLGMANQFWLHPRIEALRAAGDQRPLRALLVRQFPALVAAELLLVMTVLFVAPFLHGSARNQAVQANAAAHVTSAAAPLPKIPPKQVSASTWAWGTAETLVVIAVMIAGYRVSGCLARSRTAAATATLASRDPNPDNLVGA